MLYLFSSKPATIEAFLREKGIAFELVDKERYGIFLQSYIPQPGDWGLVYDFGKIIPDSLLQNLLLINIHFSLLPKFRGAVPVEAAILEGETETGITVQKMSKGMDAGDIMLTEKVTIQPTWTSGELQKYMDSLLPNLLEKFVAIPKEEWKFKAQEGAPTFCYMKLLNRENGLLQFETDAASKLVNKIRAFNPEPLAWVKIVRGGKVLEMNILAAEQISDVVLEPKQLQFIKKRGLAVGTKSGTILLTKVVISGSKELSNGDIVALKGSIELIEYGTV